MYSLNFNQYMLIGSQFSHESSQPTPPPGVARKSPTNRMGTIGKSADFQEILRNKTNCRRRVALGINKHRLITSLRPGLVLVLLPGLVTFQDTV